MHELFHQDGGWFFTMDLVEGIPVNAGSDTDRSGRQTTDATAETVVAEAPEDPSVDTDAPTALAPSGAPVQIHSLEELERIRQLFASLAEAVDALHGFDKLHCDIKPSNALVRADGTVVLLDFGLVNDLNGAAADGSQRIISGTIPYMSPEQTRGLPLTPASDWYAVGVMLFEALTGRCPFSGNATEILAAKSTAPPALRAEERVRLPGDLVRLIGDLLAVQPEERPAGAKVLELLRGDTGPRERDRGGVRTAAQRVFVGRASHLARLAAGLARVRGGATTTVQLSGLSGMGKTALLDRFLDRSEEAPDVIVLRGRCRERESLAFKALDPVIDALTDALARMPELEGATLLPRHTPSLARVFPVLERVPAIRNMVERSAAPASSRELRHQAFSALRELVAALADRMRVVISIDDLQWADADSVPLILELIRPPDPPVILLILSFRSEERDRSEILGALLGDNAFPSPEECAVIDVDPLDAADSERLARAVIGRNGEEVDARARDIARYAGGVPFFIETLAQHAAVETSGVTGALTRETLDSLLVASLGRLPEVAQRLMEAIALIGRPVRVAHVA